MRSARAPSLPVLLLLLAAAAGSTAGLPYVHDELLWTKADWQEYKLPFPWSAALKERDVESTRQLAGPLRGLPGNSLNGPLLDGAAVAREVQEDVRRRVAASREGLQRRRRAAHDGHAVVACLLLHPSALPPHHMRVAEPSLPPTCFVNVQGPKRGAAAEQPGDYPAGRQRQPGCSGGRGAVQGGGGGRHCCCWGLAGGPGSVQVR